MLSKNSRPLVAEFLGTFLLASSVIRGYSPFVTLGILVLIVGSVSGAHVNPAVTLGLASIKKFPMDKVIGYIAMQLLGAFVAKYINQVLLGYDMSLGYGFTDLEPKFFAAELIGAAVFLCGVVLAIGRKLDGLTLAAAVGGSLMLGALFGGGLNPAVALSLVDISLSSMAGAILGAVVGAHLGQELSEK